MMSKREKCSFDQPYLSKSEVCFALRTQFAFWNKGELPPRSSNDSSNFAAKQLDLMVGATADDSRHAKNVRDFSPLRFVNISLPSLETLWEMGASAHREMQRPSRFRVSHWCEWTEFQVVQTVRDCHEPNTHRIAERAIR